MPLTQSVKIRCKDVNWAELISNSHPTASYYITNTESSVREVISKEIDMAVRICSMNKIYSRLLMPSKFKKDKCDATIISGKGRRPFKNFFKTKFKH